MITLLALGALAAGCGKAEREPTATGQGGAPSPTVLGERTGGPVYQVDVPPPPPCKAGEACTVAVKLTALSGFKVNKEYPFKFVPAAADGVTHEGKGQFAFEGEQAGTMTVTFRAAAPGTVHVAGTFKLSVCSEDTCEIEDAPIAVDVPVT